MDRKIRHCLSLFFYFEPVLSDLLVNPAMSHQLLLTTGDYKKSPSRDHPKAHFRDTDFLGDCRGAGQTQRLEPHCLSYW
ncbi:hypothetical protein B0I35DRAFT_432406 [Stachybotrys elegans]|uniref:Secreted protein n=1 Tax=Stachybotrys elegans TaxID=80388 RepID=A0A8K0SRP8_9HYPO|nr:hypothetical protein B0I35DRAFT_432406 [Stachybotrys elegans]